MALKPFIFGGNTGIKTPQEAAHLRAVAEALASRGHTPHTIGEGLSAIGDAIASRRYRMRGERMESEGRAGWQSKYGDLVKSLIGGGGEAAPAVPDAPETPGGVVPPQPDLSQAHPEYLTGGGMPPPPSMENVANTQLPPAEDLAAMVRTVYGEAGNQSPEGQRAVAEVILNRARESGMTPSQVVMAKGQFEPWQKRAAELNALDPNSQAYQSVLGNITSAFGPDDPTGGADHFYSPGAQAALGRDTPDWAQGQQGKDIGDQRFYNLAGADSPAGGDVSISSYSPPDDVTGQPDQMAGLSIDAEPSQQPPQPQPGVQVADSGNGFDPRIIDALNDPWAPEGTKAVLGALLEQRMKQMAPVDYGITTEGGDFYRTDPRKGTVEKILDNPDPTKPTPDMQNFEFDKANGYEGSFHQWLEDKRRKEPLVQVNTGDTPDAGEKKQREAAGTEEGKRWDAMEASGSVAGGTKQDLLVLDEALKTAPQGPLTGKLAEMFPGFTSAGALANSIVKRIAPTLRTPGAGSTSDIEYEGMLNSMARLGNYPEANAAINEMMKAKADIAIERADIITAWRNQEPGFSSKEARSKLSELNKRSIMSPKMRSMLDAVGGDEKPKSDEVGTTHDDPSQIKDGTLVEDDAGKKYIIQDGKAVPVL